MQAYDYSDKAIGTAIPVPGDVNGFKEKLDTLMSQEGAAKVKIFIPVEQLRDMSPTQKLLFELKNRVKVAGAKE